MDLLGDIVYNLYGSTEVAYATIATPQDLRAAPGTVGRPPRGTTIKLLDPAGNEVPQGESLRLEDKRPLAGGAQQTLISSTSKTSVALGGMTPPAPRAP